MWLDKQQVDSIIEVVENFNCLFVVNNIGTSPLSRNDKRILKRFGINLSKLPKQTQLEHAYKFGMIADGLKYKRTAKFNYNSLKKYIADGKFTPLNDIEKATLEVLKHQMYKDVSNLKNKQINDLYQISITKHQDHKLKTIIKKEAINAVTNKSTVEEFSKALAKKSEDWNRDFGRIADYVMHSAYNHGKAMEILKRIGAKAKIWYSVKNDACNHCKRVYLNKNGEPKIFTVLDVMSNGSNIGVKPDNYKPTLYSLHPFCRCEANEYIENTIWDSVKKMFILTRNNYGINRKSKVKISYD